MEEKRTLEETCASEVCAYRGKGVCRFIEGEDYCPMYTIGKDDYEKGHLLVLIGAEFGTRAKVVNGKRVVTMDWDEFQKVSAYFFQMGKESVGA